MDAAAATEAGEERDHVISNQVSEGTDTVGLSEKLNTEAVTGGENEEDVEKSSREGLSSVAAEETKVEEDDDEDDEEEIPAVADVCEESQTGDNGEKELKPADDENEDEESVSNVKISGGGDLDEMMDIGTVDQVEQEAQMKWSEEETSTDTEKNAAESQETTSNGMKVVKLSEEEIESESMQTPSQTEKSSSPVIVVKDEPEDDEYECCITSATPAVRRNPKDGLRIGSIFSMHDDTSQLPVIKPPSHKMFCCNCKKSLQKGQKAFQRRGSTGIFCSTTCLTTFLPPSKGEPNDSPKVCHNCQKLITRLQDVILTREGGGGPKEFCSQSCLTSFNYKRKTLRKQAPPKNTPVSIAPSLRCSMCSRYCVSKHDVNVNGTVHKICSDACFNHFRTVNKVSVSGCANCGSCSHNKPMMLKMEDCSKTLCNEECLTQFKQKTKTNQPCSMCHITRPVAEMEYVKNLDDSVNLLCSSSCAMAFKVQMVSSSGARVSCDSCGNFSVPKYHLAMSDASIRNFCSLQCVTSYQEKFTKNSKHTNVFTNMLVEPTQSPASPSSKEKPRPRGSVKLECFHCTSNINSKPEVIQIKDKMVFLCTVECSLEYKKTNYVMSLCEYCKVEKITRDALRVNNKDYFFCSDGCKLLYRHDLSKEWGKHCNSCVNCHSMSQKVVMAQYGGATEEFCSGECRSKYTMLFCHVAKCDMCGRKGKLKQSLPLLGEVKHFCHMTCLLQFCNVKVATQGDVEKPHAVKDTPLIYNVMSLADSPPEKSRPTLRSSRRRTSTRISEQTSTSTETVSSPPPRGQKVLKNKALMCKPLMQTKGVSCRTQTTDGESQTEDLFPKVMIVPVPVPVYVPVPMSMYSQCTPQPLSMPLPLPVPVLVPVTMKSADGIIKTIKELKEKIPNDPYEAELILMAEMVADGEEEEKKEEDDEAPAPSSDDVVSSDDLDNEDLDSFLDDMDDASSSEPRPKKRKRVKDKNSKKPPVVPPPMDIEEDFSVETLEKMALLRELPENPSSPPPSTGGRRQAPRKTRGRKSQRSSKEAEDKSMSMSSEIPKLKTQYGIDAWKRWIQWRKAQPDIEQPRFSRHFELKEDILRCTTTELSYGLCCFIREVRRPNGEPYSTDSLFYLCLGIQQYLFENSRVENIFMDHFYTKFSTDFTNMLRSFTPSITSSGYIHSRVEEGFLWDCKQLGAYSPIVLLNTLLFFCCKYFGFTTVKQHRQLSFAHVMRCTKTNPNNTKTSYLRFYPPLSLNEPETDLESVAAKRRKEENTEENLEMTENPGNPLRCPVRLYDFYLSKCSDSVKQRTNVFYLHPERCCVPNSPLWFTATPLDDSTMDAMLVRILTVRELHLKKAEGQAEARDPTFVPEDEELGEMDSD
ncbi:zinc finger MYM-type protein 4 isoform X2 [Gouania willdenowi]|uniref:zinc finger MYM-type protein 4 isoform X2 n=1 Tax=Gouania willdenowi TaxID=441366 RepID=UPI00105674DA|nr:zinc finger MYM-type protein 4 isoform X2 [Gouania willdenowi]